MHWRAAFYFTFVRCPNGPSAGPSNDPSPAIVKISVWPPHVRLICLPLCAYVHADPIGPKLTLACPPDWNTIVTQPAAAAYVCPFTLFPHPATHRQISAAAAAHPLRLLTFITGLPKKFSPLTQPAFARPAFRPALLMLPAASEEYHEPPPA